MERRTTVLAWMVSLLLLQALATGCVAPIPPPSEPTTPAAPVPPTTTVVLPNGTVVAGPATLDSLKQAQALAAFTLLEPDPETLPPALQLNQVLWWTKDERGAEVVSVAYQGSGQDLAITQLGSPYPMAAPAEPHQSFIVRGQKGYLSMTGGARAFIWEEKQDTIRVAITVSSDNLNIDELTRIAEGLRAVQSDR